VPPKFRIPLRSVSVNGGRYTFCLPARTREECMIHLSLSRFTSLVLLSLLCLAPLNAHAYSLLTHEQLIDLTWHDSIVPLLLSRYPNMTPAELEQARAYAYGGCVIQDIGYYPFGDRNFSNLTHYVRSGDFVVNLLRNAQNANELAFAIGALSHYIGDTYGHSEATNLAVPVEFPKLQAKYGDTVNYAEGPHQHVQTEFAFDIDQISQHHLAPLTYLRHVGLKVPVRLVGVAFYQTYGLADFDQQHLRRVKVREYRFAVRTFIPRIAYAVTLLKRKHEPPEPDTADSREIEKEAAAAASTDGWDQYRTNKPRFVTRLLAGLIFILPKVGPLSLADVKGPQPETEKEYMHSLAQSVAGLRYALRRFTPLAQQLAAPTGAIALEQSFGPLDPLHPLPNRDLDTGQVSRLGGYPLTDKTYYVLLHSIVRNPGLPTSPGIKRDIQAFFSSPNPPATPFWTAPRWSRVKADIALLKSMPTRAEPEPFPTYESGAANNTD
jgi:hypothetical protein